MREHKALCVGEVVVENSLGRGKAQCRASKEGAGLAGSRASGAGTWGGGRGLITPTLPLAKAVSA